MTFKVFLVEDEVTTREGIRDNVDWQAAGFELCCEASDGEMALPQIEALQPDVLITDIRMPFMDGLQLAKILREHMPWMKVIIISGYSDFQYAQTAVKLGVTEYLVKPVSVQDLQAVLLRVAVTLNQEKGERAYLKQLSRQAEDSLGMLREKFLLRLVAGGESSLSAIEQSQQLGLNLPARYYQVVLLEARSAGGDLSGDYAACQQVEKILLETIGVNPDVLFTKKDIDKFVLIVKGESHEQIEQEGAFLVGLIRADVARKTAYTLAAGVGAPQQRLGELHRSFSEALVKLRETHAGPSAPELGAPELGAPEVSALDHAALQRFLHAGHAGDLDPRSEAHSEPSFDAPYGAQFEAFFEHALRPPLEAALRSPLLKRYVLLDILLTISQFISDLGGAPDQILKGHEKLDELVARSNTLPELRAVVAGWLGAARAFSERQSGSDRAAVIQQAKDYPEIKIIASKSGDFLRSRGKEVMADMLNQYGNRIDALYSHNDDMAIGAIKAIESYGLQPGVDIKIVSIDAIRDAFQAMIDGKLNATVECNPLLGPKFFELALAVANGEQVQKLIPSLESVYFPKNAAEILPTRKY